MGKAVPIFFGVVQMGSLRLLHVLTVSLVFALSPFAAAHLPPGASDECQPGNGHPLTSHDYVPGIPFGVRITAAMDGNGTGDCNGDGVPGDFDGENEWGISGALMFSGSTVFAPYCMSPPASGCDPSTADVTRIDGSNGGTLRCYGFETIGHHPAGGAYRIEDWVLGGDPGLAMTSDWRRRDDPGEWHYVSQGSSTGNEAFDHNCGDDFVEPCDPIDPSEVDQVTCNSRDGRTSMGSLVGPASPTTSFRVLAAPLYPGQDGAYWAFVSQGTSGHITS